MMTRTLCLTLFRVLLLLQIVIVFVVTSMASAAVTEDRLETDISSHLISVESDFTGTELVLFGAIQPLEDIIGQNTGDIIVVVRGPNEDIVVRQKSWVAGIWVNTESVSFSSVPGFYTVASNRAVEEITDAGTLARHNIGLERLNFESTLKDETKEFNDAIIRQRVKNGLFADAETTVSMLGKSLFRTTITFPANVPVGNYVAEFYLFRNGDLISAQTSPLFIKKFGLGRSVYDFAQEYPGSYGILAILIALAAGWLAAVIFRTN